MHWLSPYELPTAGTLDFYWFLSPDGSGQLFMEVWTDQDGAPCPVDTYCGWHEASSPPGALYGSGVFHLVAVPAFPVSGNEISDFTACAYP